MRQLLAKNLKRGKVDCTMHLRSVQAAERELRIDAAALERVAAAVAQVRAPLPGSHRRCASKCCAGPGVIETASASDPKPC